jgi:hypothetical protein
MNRSKFKDFIVTYANWTLSSEVNKWLEENPYIKIIRWSASPCGQNGTRLVIEYQEINPSTSICKGTQSYFGQVTDPEQCVEDTGWPIN